MSRTTAAVTHGALVVAGPAAAWAVVDGTQAGVLSGMALMIASIVVSLKLASYAHYCNDLRRSLAEGEWVEPAGGPGPARRIIWCSSW